MNEVEYKTFLNNFPPLKRSLIMNQFLTAIRQGHASTVNEVLNWVHNDSIRRRNPYADDEARALQTDLSSRLLSDEAARLAEYALWYEALPSEERDKLKSEKSQEYQKRWLATHPPTLKQLVYLKAHGCQEKPANGLEASEWIDKLINK